MSSFCKPLWIALFVLGVVSMSGVVPTALAADKPNYEAVLQNLKWRELGPAIMGGRIDDFAVVESNPNIVYVGIASGGVWKTTNGGTGHTAGSIRQLTGERRGRS